MLEWTGCTKWSYDDTYRLTQEVRSGATSYDIQHIYDSVGNRLVELKDGAPTTFTYDSANQLETKETASGLTTYSYDGAGNLTTEENSTGTRTNIWTPDNRLSKVILPNSDESSFLYNADGLRVSKEDPSGTSRFLWDRKNVLSELNDVGVTQATYTLQPNIFGNLLSQRRAASSNFHLFDALGSTANLTNASASITDSFLYEAYGNIANRIGSTQTPYGWVGKVGYQWDEILSGQYVRERWYLPFLGRWLTEDPHPPHNDFRNLFAYVHSRYTYFTDPSGLQEGNPFGGTVLPGEVVIAEVSLAELMTTLALSCFFGTALSAIIQTIHDANTNPQLVDNSDAMLLCNALAGCAAGIGIGAGGTFLVSGNYVAGGLLLGGGLSVYAIICAFCKIQLEVEPCICEPINAAIDLFAE